MKKRNFKGKCEKRKVLDFFVVILLVNKYDVRCYNVIKGKENKTGEEKKEIERGRLL